MLCVICPLVFFASFVDAIAGGGGLISLPAYFLTGMPAHMAIGSNKFSAAVGTAISTARFIRSGHFHLRIALETAVIAYLGSSVGAKIALQVSDQYLRYIMMVLLPCVAVFVLFNRRQMSEKSRIEEFPHWRIILGMVITGFGIGMYDGFFGPGTGTFLIIAFTALMGFDLKRACGNTKIVNLTTNIAALIVFITAGQIYYKVAIPATIFSILGNWLGSGMAIRKGAQFIRPIMFAVLCVLLIKIAYDMFGTVL